MKAVERLTKLFSCAVHELQPEGPRRQPLEAPCPLSPSFSNTG